MTMLTILSNACKSKESYEEAVENGKSLHRGCKGIYHGAKANVLDALQILKMIWEGDAKYATIDGIKRCWRKAGILPVLMNIELINDV